MANAPRMGEYEDGRFWFQRKKGTTLILGVTGKGLEELGTLQQLELPEEGKDFEKGEQVGQLIGSEGTLSFVFPAGGVVQEVNSGLSTQEFQLVQEDPGQEGWLVKIEIEDLSDLLEYEDE